MLLLFFFSGKKSAVEKNSQLEEEGKTPTFFDIKRASPFSNTNSASLQCLTCARLERRALRGAAAGRPVPRKAARDVACFCFWELRISTSPALVFFVKSRLREG
jgi:hypothetical protein